MGAKQQGNDVDQGRAIKCMHLSIFRQRCVERAEMGSSLLKSLRVRLFPCVPLEMHKPLTPGSSYILLHTAASLILG